MAKLTFAARCTLIDWVAGDVAGKVPLGVTISGQSVAEQIAMVAHAEQAGADWLILQPPAVGNYDAAEYLRFFGRVMRSTPCPSPSKMRRNTLGAAFPRRISRRCAAKIPISP